MYVIDGRTIGDLKGRFTCVQYNGRSTVDKTLGNRELEPYIRYLLQCNKTMLQNPYSKTENSKPAPVGFKWNNDSTEAFQKTLKLCVISHSLNISHVLLTQSSVNVNHLSDNINNALLNAAKCSLIKKVSTQSKVSIPKWFT